MIMEKSSTQCYTSETQTHERYNVMIGGCININTTSEDIIYFIFNNSKKTYKYSKFITFYINLKSLLIQASSICLQSCLPYLSQSKDFAYIYLGMDSFCYISFFYFQDNVALRSIFHKGSVQFKKFKYNNMFLLVRD